MAEKTSGGRKGYQGCVSNTRRGFVRGCSNSYNRCQGCGFNMEKPKFWGKCEVLGSNVYSIGDVQQADKYTKTMEAILNHIQGNFNKINYVKEVLEELNDY